MNRTVFTYNFLIIYRIFLSIIKKVMIIEFFNVQLYIISYKKIFSKLSIYARILIILCKKKSKNNIFPFKIRGERKREERKIDNEARQGHTWHAWNGERKATRRLENARKLAFAIRAHLFAIQRELREIPSITDESASSRIPNKKTIPPPPPFILEGKGVFVVASSGKRPLKGDAIILLGEDWRKGQTDGGGWYIG